MIVTMVFGWMALMIEEYIIFMAMIYIDAILLGLIFGVLKK